MENLINHPENDMINGFTTEVIDLTLKYYEQEKEIVPAVFVLVKPEKEGLKPSIGLLKGIEEFFTSDQKKRLLPKVMEQICKGIKPISIALVTEAWVAKKKVKDDEPLDLPKNYKVSKDPERKSIIMLHFETFTKVNMIHYQQNDDKTLGEKEESGWIVKDKNKDFGVLGNLLKNYSDDFADDIEKIIFKDNE